jgi:hypothetical protein
MLPKITVHTEERIVSFIPTGFTILIRVKKKIEIVFMTIQV